MRRPDPVEAVAIAIPVLAEAVAVTLFIAMLAVWTGLAAEWRHEHLSRGHDLSDLQRVGVSRATAVKP